MGVVQHEQKEGDDGNKERIAENRGRGEGDLERERGKLSQWRPPGDKASPRRHRLRHRFPP
eukprot:scaffold13908_cov106-Isochrysis_galbana.AAC.1